MILKVRERNLIFIPIPYESHIFNDVFKYLNFANRNDCSQITLLYCITETTERIYDFL